MNVRNARGVILTVLGVLSCHADETVNGPDVIPPSSITDLAATRSGSEFQLHWTAPGDDGTKGRASLYAVRYAENNIGACWDSALSVSSLSTPSAAGAAESVLVGGIGWGPWEFAVRAADEAGNWSSLSNVALSGPVPGDTLAPAPVTDLAKDVVTSGSVVLRWTATGDNGGIARAARYEMRYAASPITDATWVGATPAIGLPAPGNAGELETFELALVKKVIYFIVLRVADEAGNWSPLSNSVQAMLRPAVQLTHTEMLPVLNADWSPDGRFISCTMWIGNSPQVYVVPAAGGAPIRYTSFPDGATSASWSWDGRQFAFCRFHPPNSGMFMLGDLAVMPALPDAPDDVLVSDSTLSVALPSWSPDGAYIAYLLMQLPLEEADLYVIPFAGGTARQLTGGWSMIGVDWSPDGSRIAYSSKESGSYDIWTIQPDGNNPTRLTTGQGSETAPRWSRDGSRIAYLVDDDAIWIASSTGERPFKVIYDSRLIPLGGFSWSPDGNYIAYPGTMDGLTDIWVQRIR